MNLHELWECVDANTPVYYECMDFVNECVKIEEYDGTDRCITGSRKVFSIKPYFMAGFGNVILATME